MYQHLMETQISVGLFVIQHQHVLIIHGISEITLNNVVLKVDQDRTHLKLLDQI